MSSRKHFIVGGDATNILFRSPRGLWDRITRGQAPKTLPDVFLASGRARALIASGQLIEVEPPEEPAVELKKKKPTKQTAKKKKRQGV